MRAARKAAGLTQQNLAKKLRRPQSFVSKYEKAHQRLDVVEFVEVSRALGVDPSEALTLLSEPDAPRARRTR
ncbi:MAG TPA: helix-turn-helix transcriptional regulator [Burkholderiales bacterium]|nr:helix-turn-helix transcriptional regulator [Burkholderiales bacterium]